MADTTQEYKLPYVTKIPYTLAEGKTITIGGVVNANTDDGFYLGFSKLEDVTVERTFHYSARFTENVVVRNHRAEGSWGDEERTGSFPFKSSAPFEVKIVVYNSHYRVFVDGNQHISFKHRLPKETAQYLYIEGVVTIDRVIFGEADIKEDYTVPLVLRIPYTLEKGKVIIIGGAVNKDTDDGFFIGFSKLEDVTVERTFHYSARFTENVVVRNHRAEGSWGDEERWGGFPFKSNSPFEVKIVVQKNRYRVYVDGKHHTNFNHRLPKETALYLYIEGVVTVDRVIFGESDYKLPYITTLPYVLDEGKEIYIAGSVNESAKGFRFGFSVDGNYSSETAFDFNALVSDSVVVRNHQYKGWGTEERHGYIPFYTDVSFEVRIIVLNYCYRVYVNDEHHSDFNHRLTKEAMRHLYIEGDLIIDKVSFQETDVKKIFAVPHVSSLPYTLAEGKEIVVGGVVEKDAKEFRIGLSRDPDFSNDTPLDFRVNFSDKMVIMNHNSDVWGDKQTSSEVPFKVGSPFEVKFVVRNHCYKIYVDDDHHSDFKHRMNKEEVRHIYINEGLTVSRLSFKDTFTNPTLPLTVPILGGLYLGRTVIVSGIPNGDDRFTINFLTGITADRQDVAFCYDTRFNYRGHLKKVVRTHKGSGKWGVEETQITSFPFSANVAFKLTFKVHKDVISVSADDREYLDFKHREPSYQRVSYLNITGAVKITELKV